MNRNLISTLKAKSVIVGALIVVEPEGLEFDKR